MRVVITGATGNVGTSLLGSLSDERAVDEVVGIARRAPRSEWPKTRWQAADVAADDLTPVFAGADAVVHLAWLIQPSHDLPALRRVNVEGSRRVFRAAADAGVSSLVYASSVGAYSPGPKDRAVDESWPAEGIPTSFYARHKAAVERLLDSFEREHPEIRTVRLRPALIFKREAGSEVRRLFFGPFLPNSLIRRSLIPLVPDVPRLRFQTVHSLDVGDAYRLALTRDVRGAFNIAADPVLDPEELRRLLRARRLSIPPAVIRTATDLTWRLHMQPTPRGWVDMGLQTPIMDTTRATDVLGWRPRFDSKRAILDLLDGLREGAGIDTPPLAAGAGGPLRIGELLSGVGRR